jgi:hypothetical protein
MITRACCQSVLYQGPLRGTTRELARRWRANGREQRYQCRRSQVVRSRADASEDAGDRDVVIASFSGRSASIRGEESPRLRIDTDRTAKRSRVRPVRDVGARQNVRRGAAALKIDSRRRHGQLDVGLVVVFCSPCFLERPCRAVEEDPMPGLSPRGGGDVSAGRAKAAFSAASRKGPTIESGRPPLGGSIKR